MLLGKSQGAACPAPFVARALRPSQHRLWLPSALGSVALPIHAGSGLQGTKARKWVKSNEVETALARARPSSEQRGCMTRPARLCGLWVLLLCTAIS